MPTDSKTLPHGEDRRSFLKAATATMAAPLILTSRKSAAQAPPVVPPSPATTPWVEELPDQITPIQGLTAGDLPYYPKTKADAAGGECGRDDHDTRFFYDDNYGLTLHQLSAMENPSWVFNPALPAQRIWGFAPGINPSPAQSITPGPTFHARYGQPILCRIRNELDSRSYKTGFGTPEITTHNHNQHGESISDGFAGNYYSATKKGPTLTAPGRFQDYFWPNVYAGLEEFPYGVDGVDYGNSSDKVGDYREALGTMFYHNHTMDFTAPNVLRGMVGFYLLFDALDSGNEVPDPYNPRALRLPSGAYDYPLAFADKRFDASGQLFFDQMNPEGTLGDKVTVNGKIEPVLKVARRKYRFRLLNGGPSRFYEFYLANKSNNTTYTFTHISNDGNLFPAPLFNQIKVRLGVAERADIIVDFSKFAPGTELFLVNRLDQVTTRKPANVVPPGTKLLKFIVGPALPAGSDVSQVPSQLRPLRPLLNPTEIAALPVRTWLFSRTNGMWAVNGKFFNVHEVRAQMQKGATEVWELVNNDNGWEHPIHIHFEEGRILSRTLNGVNQPLAPHEQGRKDVYVLRGPEKIRVLLRFRDFTGKYLMHCHNMIHEDHQMMVRWDIT